VGGSATILPTTPPGLTLEGTILGTFQYMAPEQLEGREVDTRTDIFAFGALLYEMATGRKAFDGRTQASVMGAILKDTPPPMAGFEPAIPAALDRLVTRCLAKDTDRRWQTARDLEDELRWIAEGGHTSIDDMPTSHPSASSSTGRKRSRHRNDEPGGRTSLRS
jgi:serine/threonine protein kinase